MCSDDCPWVERLDFVEGGDPLASLLRSRVGKIEVNVVVDGITGNHESNRRDIQTGCVIRVRVTKFHGDQFLPFQIDDIPFQLLRNNKIVRHLTGKCCLPDRTKEVRGGILAHYRNCIGRCHCFGVWESLKKSTDSKPMVSMTMCDVNSCQVFVF